MAKSKLVTSQFVVTLVEYCGPDADPTKPSELEEVINDRICDGFQGTVMVHSMSKPKVLVEGQAA